MTAFLTAMAVPCLILAAQAVSEVRQQARRRRGNQRIAAGIAALRPCRERPAMNEETAGFLAYLKGEGWS